jgi:hypothetical protein
MIHLVFQTYPNMDAFSAFVFALNPHTTSKCTGRINMAQETQVSTVSCADFLVASLFHLFFCNLIVCCS